MEYSLIFFTSTKPKRVQFIFKSDPPKEGTTISFHGDEINVIPEEFRTITWQIIKVDKGFKEIHLKEKQING